MTARRRRPAILPPADRARVLRLCRENLRLLHRLVQHDEVGRTAAALDGRELSSPEAVVAYLGPEMADLAQEQLRAVLLDRKNRMLAVSFVYQGGIDTIAVCLRDCFRDAVRANAAGVILVHNHPSGDPTPSLEDRIITLEAARAGALLDIELVDHIIVGREGHVSLRRAGLFAPSGLPVIGEREAV
jgi:DNA repair protein RadC